MNFGYVTENGVNSNVRYPVTVLFYGISLITKLLTAKGKELADQAVSSDETKKNNVEK